MIKELYRDVCEDKNVRASLIEIKKVMKEPQEKRMLAYELGGDFSVLIKLLKDEDPKIRKNAALILGEMESEDLMNVLFEAYQREDTLFIKCDFLKALSNYPYEVHLNALKERLKEIQKQPIDESNGKHIREESAMLQGMILKYEKPLKHTFTGNDKSMDVILLTNRNHREVTRDQILDTEVKMLAGGIRVTTENLGRILPVRTYREILFPLEGVMSLSGTPENMARELFRSNIVQFLEKMHDGPAPFYFRIGLKSKMPLDQKGPFIKKLSAAIELRSKRKLINSASDYELELRLVENKSGAYIPLLKLFTIEDKRFSYRKEAIATSITPANAALIMELVKEYLKDGAQVLDPFCGVGTMLIERCRKVSANPMYGLDILEEAIEKARDNTKRADLIINYIQRDFFDFKHEYLFDEIVTNMPGLSRTRDDRQLQQIYNSFFEKSAKLLKEDCCIILYSDEKDILFSSLRNQNYFRIVKEEPINDRDGSAVYVLIRK